MEQSKDRKALRIGALLVMSVGVSLASVQSEASAMMMSTTEITTTVNNPASPSEPNGTCSKCRVTTERDNGGTTASISVYFDDDGEDFSGDFEIEVLANGSYYTTSIDNAFVAHQSTEDFVVTEGVGWDWDDVTHVWIEAFPG